MDIQVGDILRMKKEHPGGSKEMLVLRVGASLKSDSAKVPSALRAGISFRVGSKRS